MSAIEKKISLFQRGEKSSNALFSTTGIYRCPLCGIGFDESSLENKKLTLEHVPPKAMGGKGIILTCKECNGSSGQTIDANASKHKEFDDNVDVVLRKKLGNSARVQMCVGDIKINASMDYDGETSVARVDRRINNPYVIERAIKIFTENISESESITINVHGKFSERYSNISDLRVAFLACAALFGYKFSLSDELISVRNQISKPDERIFGLYCLRWEKRLDKKIILSTDGQFLVVYYRKKGILLPWMDQSRCGYYDFIRKMTEGESVSASMVVYDWPTTILSILDKSDARAAIT